ncbi:hypothetical protein [Streptomyces cupreus]|uniref:Secreted protein n=1 Tax=Streptomyces cupreus TaxID=2759956 RepID=A0A7X1MES6_9ACTN|nr:hypothetical protein [Streptomyces cupreus]MBC2908303.1 hypothetical protein [Streptomyces cupreus]
MISTRRIVAAVGLAAAATGFAAPMASAAEAEATNAGSLSPMRMLDSLAVSDIAEEHKAEIPRPSAQLNQLNRVHELNQLHQVTDMVAPVTNLVPGIEY